jgi:hypothetical protein
MDESREALFREACRWLAKKAPEGADQTQWLIQHGLVTEDGEYLTPRGNRTLRRAMNLSNDFATRLMAAANKSDKDIVGEYIEKLVEVLFADDVAKGDVIRLARKKGEDSDTYVNAEHFDPAKHKRANDVRLLEMTRADIESLIRDGVGHPHMWKMILSVAELTGWPEVGSPVIWLLDHEYLERREDERGLGWSAKATRNKKLCRKLKQLPSLFSLDQQRRPSA